MSAPTPRQMRKREYDRLWRLANKLKVRLYNRKYYKAFTKPRRQAQP